MTLGSLIYAFLIIAAILIVCWAFWWAVGAVAPQPLKLPLQVLIVVLGAIAVAIVLVSLAGGGVGLGTRIGGMPVMLA